MTELREALEQLLHAVCGETGFAAAVRNDSGTAYPWPALDIAEEAARAALAAHPVEAEAMEWQPKETAPRDGSWFLTYSPDKDSDGGLHFDFAAWVEEFGDFCKVSCGWQYVTHWMPVPALLRARSGILSAEKEVG